MLRNRLNSVLKNEASPPPLVTPSLSPCRTTSGRSSRQGLEPACRQGLHNAPDVVHGMARQAGWRRAAPLAAAAGCHTTAHRTARCAAGCSCPLTCRCPVAAPHLIAPQVDVRVPRRRAVLPHAAVQRSDHVRQAQPLHRQRPVVNEARHCRVAESDEQRACPGQRRRQVARGLAAGSSAAAGSVAGRPQHGARLGAACCGGCLTAAAQRANEAV